VNVKEFLNFSLKGLKESLLLGLSEAEELGKSFIGLTLSNGDGLIFYVNPYLDEIYGVFLYTQINYQEPFLKACCVYKNEVDQKSESNNGNTYFIYEITNFNDFVVKMGTQLSVIYVEVIQGDLEDFLLTALGG
jgi:hypothetical protein